MNLELTIEKYRCNQKVIIPVKESLIKKVKELLAGCTNIDNICGRVKTVESFKDKASKLIDGEPKYSNPLTQIHDQIGIRVVVYYKSDVKPIQQIIRRNFTAIEFKDIVPDEVLAFGYEGTHLILTIPSDYRVVEYGLEDCPEFFEFQIHTLFQHAWAEANHNLQYKQPIHLSKIQERKLAFTAAQAWGADQIFEDLLMELRLK